MDFSALTQAFNTIKNKVGELPQQFGAIPEAIGQGMTALQQSTRPYTLPVTQVLTGVQQRVNSPFLSNPITPMERKFNTADFNASGDVSFMNQPQNIQHFNTAEALGNYGWEAHPSAYPQEGVMPPPVSTSPQINAIKNQALQSFTPYARFQLSAIPTGVMPPNHEGIQGQSFGGGGNRSLAVREGLPMVEESNANEVAVHELLHAATRGIGGINTNQFLQDFVNVQNKLPIKLRLQLINFYNDYPKDENLGEEMFAQVGALMGSRVFNTPLGKYYEGILQKPTTTKIPIRRKKNG